MKNITFFLFLLTVALTASFCGTQSGKSTEDFVGANVKFAAAQYGLQAAAIEDSGRILYRWKNQVYQAKGMDIGFFPW